jgi:hypothetical protein
LCSVAFWVPGAKTTGPIAKKFGFSSNFFGSEKFQVSAHVLPKHKVLLCKITFSCTFAVIQILDNIGSTVYFCGDFNETFRLLFFHAHWWQLAHETSFLLLNGSH